MQVAFTCICNTSCILSRDWLHAFLFLKQNHPYLLIAGLLAIFQCPVNAQVSDTLKSVKIISKKQLNIAASTVTVQQLDRKQLGKLNSFSVADAVKYFSGVVVKDYGGIGGLKTISVRSLGASQTGVMYDGIILGDAQGGQIDLGRLPLDNIETIQLYNNQPTNILLPARSFASAAILSLSTIDASGSNNRALTLKCMAGSFGLINPAIAYHGPVNKKISHSINAGYQSAKGNYPFIDYETGRNQQKRINSDIKAYRVEYDIQYAANDSNRVKFKSYYYHSERGLPGSVILYNSKTGERLNNRLFFTQASWQKSLSPKSRMLISGKYASDYKYYIDPTYANSAGRLENEFQQQEIYLSAAYSYQLMPGFTAGLAGDFFNTQLERTDAFAQNFSNPRRNTFLANAAAQFKKNSVELSANMLFTASREKVTAGIPGKPQNEFTPSFSGSFRPFGTLPLHIRTSYKKIFRLPTFDDLYYTNVGNTSLRPEFADQYNIGITFRVLPESVWDDILFTSDAYYNNVTDKILAVPRQNLFQWSMLNIGKVEVKGADIGAHFNWKKWEQFEISTHLSYCYQHATDNSDPASALYKNQLPYTPQHSGSISLHIQRNNIGLNYNAILSSFRYRPGEQIPENLVKEWATQDLSASYEINTRNKMKVRLLAEANNVMNNQYEIIKYYPMPRFNYRIGIEITFNQ